MLHTLLAHFAELKKIDNNRKAWLMLSAAVVTAVGFLIFDTQRSGNNYILWVFGSATLIISVSWWYWVMRDINKLIKQRYDTLSMFTTIAIDVINIKKEIKDLRDIQDKLTSLH